MFEEFNLKKKDAYILIFITVFSALLVWHYINFNCEVGVACSDVYLYLLNALYYTGININSTKNIYLSPIICFLTSILFRMGLVDKLAIFIVTGLFAIFGNIGMYLLLKRYFDELLSLTGTIIFSTCTLCLTWLANGTLDVPATGMIIWIALFTLIAIKDNSKFYKYLIPLFILGFFTRYTVILTLPALVLYYVLEKGFTISKDDLKYIKSGLIIGAILIIIIMAAILLMSNNQFFAKDQIAGGIAGNKGSDTDPAYNTDLFYYVTNLPNFISNSHSVFEANPVLENPTPLSWTIFGILLLGLGFWIYDSKLKITKKDMIPIVLFIVAILTYTRISSVITTAMVLVGLYLLGKDSDNKVGYFMLGWIFSNLIYLSYYNIKVNRYIIPIFPPLVYFILTAITNIHRHIKINKNIIPVFLIVLFLIQGFAFTLTFEPTEKYSSTEEISNYIIENNPDYQNMSIGAYNLRPYCWWLTNNILGIPAGDWQTIDSSNVTYYISNIPQDNLTNYTEIKQIDNLHLYEKIA